MAEISYEQACQELNDIIKKIEEGKVNMSQSLELFERGKLLLEICYQNLEKAKGKFTEIKESIDKLEEV